MYSFLLLSSLSGIIELGSVYLGIYLGLSIPEAISLPLFYQLGNLMLNYVSHKKQCCIASSVIVIILSILCSAEYQYVVLAVQLVLSSYCIQVCRVAQKKSCPVWLKRAFRVGGFAVSPVMLIANGQAVLLISMGYCFVLSMKSANVSLQTQDKECRQLSLVMIFHQLHYFVYTYIMPVYVLQLTNSYLLSGLAFAVTWIVYLMPQTIADNMKIKKYRLMFFICHSFLAVCMGMMAYASMLKWPAAVLVFWLLTGLGGGSVFCIKHLSSHYSQINMDLSENIGHVAGPAIAVLLCRCFPDNEIFYLSTASCIFVVSALLSAFGLKMKGAKNEHQVC